MSPPAFSRRRAEAALWRAAQAESGRNELPSGAQTREKAALEKSSFSRCQNPRLR
jgi:hypothetical protein